MDQTLTALGALAVGAILGYVVRHLLVAKRAGNIEQRIKRRIAEADQEKERILQQAKTQADQLLKEAAQEEKRRRGEVAKTEQLILRREQAAQEKLLGVEAAQKEAEQAKGELEREKRELGEKRQEALDALQKAAGMTAEEAKERLVAQTAAQFEQDIAGRIRKLEQEGEDRYERRAKEIVAYAIQKNAVPQTQEITTSTVQLPSEDLKGKIIGKEGRNVRSLERLTGVEIVVDESPETVVISGFDPLRRHIAKVVLERLIKDGRIQPARVEEEVAKVSGEVESQIKEAGETAVYELGIVGLDPKLIRLLGRLKFRTSYGQNVLLHSIEVAYLASALASEIGADGAVAKKAGLFHDIGKALDHEVEGSHVDIGIRILEKFGAEPAVVNAMKSHHEDYPYESVEAILVQAADAISASRPGARKDTLENYLKRIGELESLASSFEGVEKAYAIQAGREIRVFVTPDKVDDVASKKMARDIAERIEQELKYPGEIKVTLIRENRFVEHAK